MYDVWPRWRGLPLVPSKAAARELFSEGLRLLDVKEALEEGDASGARRTEGVYECVLPRGNRSLKVVVAESYSYSLHSHCWVVVHVKSVRAKRG